MDLKDKVAVVTGASKGIGRQIAMDLARAGSHVAVSARTPELLDSLGADIKTLGRNVFTFTGDMSLEEDIKTFIKRAHDTFGRLDILINNAGIGYFHPAALLTTQQWDEMFNLNVRGLFIATREAIPYLRQAGEAMISEIDIRPSNP